MDRLKARTAAATCRGEEIMVRWCPGTAIGGGAPMLAAAWAAAAVESWESFTTKITRLGTDISAG